MAEHEPTSEQLAQIAAENEEDEHSVNYKAPAPKSINEIQAMDQDDESLRKYKEALLGSLPSTVGESDPSVPNVVVTKLTLVCAEAPGPLELNLRGDLEKFKKETFYLKEGVEYRIKISFKVHGEIVSGLKYQQQTCRKGVKLDKSNYMVGSYGPRAEEYEFLTPRLKKPQGACWPGAVTR
ncbi:unnamed protein product [Staurois parvus]|uniref:Rho GDP-dissociation inhibitor 1 n=1 Tax=Staurois parvus TaxID=386267 RepID=A0ABN9DB34_9NEOB|nr:unnamed protein product [Staurois parvus]